MAHAVFDGREHSTLSRLTLQFCFCIQTSWDTLTSSLVSIMLAWRTPSAWMLYQFVSPPSITALCKGTEPYREYSALPVQNHHHNYYCAGVTGLSWEQVRINSVNVTSFLSLFENSASWMYWNNWSPSCVSEYDGTGEETLLSKPWAL